MNNPITKALTVIGNEREEWRRTARVVQLGLRGLVKSQIPRMGAALSYRTIFSLIPVLVVSASVMGQFLSDEELASQINEVVAFIGLDTIALDDMPATLGGDGEGGGAVTPEAAPEEKSQTAARIIAPSPTRLDEWITSLVERVTSLPFSKIGIVGLLVLIYGAIAMLVELERSFNQIYQVSNGRAWTKRVTTYWTTLTLGLVFLLATFSVGDRVGDWVASIGKADGEQQGLIAGGIVDFAVSVVINTILLLFAYMTVPNARVHFRPALVGASVAGLGWEIGKSGFTAYVANAVDNLQQLYGVLALLPLFLFWVYITWIIVLFGLQVAYSLQHFSVWSEESEKPEVGLVDPGIAVRFAVDLARAFQRGDTVDAGTLAERAGVPGSAAVQVIGGLVKGGVARRTDGKGGETAFVLARPAGQILVGEVLDVAQRVRAGGEQGGSRVVDARLRSSIEGMTLEAVAAADDERAQGGEQGGA